MSQILYQCLFRVEFGSIAPIIRHTHHQLLSPCNSSSMSITLYAAGFKFSDPQFKTLFKHFLNQCKQQHTRVTQSGRIVSLFVTVCDKLIPIVFQLQNTQNTSWLEKKYIRLIIQLELINIKNQNYKLRPTVLNESVSRSCTR